MLKEFFEGIPVVTCQGSYASHPFAFRYYDAERIVAGRPMREHFRFALPLGAARAFGLSGSDFLLATMELLHKLGAGYYTLSDRALAEGGGSLREHFARLGEMAEAMACLQDTFRVECLRVHADLCSHPRYYYGAATSYSADIFAFAAAQAKKSLEIARLLGARQFSYSAEQETRGGFYLCVNDTLECENLLRMLQGIKNCAQGYPGRLGLRLGAPNQNPFAPEPYWPSAAHALAFLRWGGLENEFLVDLSAQAPLSELRLLLQTGRLGLLEQRPGGGSLVIEAAKLQLELLRAGNWHGGIVLDLPPARACATPEDYVIHCIMHMDAWACGLLLAQRLLLDGRTEQFRRERYGTFGYGIGRALLEGRADFAALEQHALQKGEAAALTGREEYLENVLMGMVCRGL